MKKIASILSSIITVAALTFVPAVVHAQSTIDIGDSTSGTTDPTTPLPSTGGTDTPATPDTGIAPSENKVVANSLVFVGGAALGAALGYGFLSYRKRQQN
ncbi:MAG: hypothetical protein U0520_02490 [Candidatus Saccharimonadales bacterium]